jgi:hypothetical protein
MRSGDDIVIGSMTSSWKLYELPEKADGPHCLRKVLEPDRLHDVGIGPQIIAFESILFSP